MKKEKNSKGITLIALVVTIIVLIILATVSINMVFNENGLIKQAEKAKEYQANAVESDQGTLERYANYINGDSDDEVGGDNEDNIEKIGDFYKGNAGKINITIPEEITSPENVTCTLYKVGTINGETVEWDTTTFEDIEGFTTLDPTEEDVKSVVYVLENTIVRLGGSGNEDLRRES